jgi:hypothetical protein
MSKYYTNYSRTTGQPTSYTRVTTYSDGSRDTETQLHPFGTVPEPKRKSFDWIKLIVSILVWGLVSWLIATFVPGEVVMAGLTMTICLLVWAAVK